jgi:ankyrin repeat protein
MLAKSRNLAALRKSLASLPQTLDQTYDRILAAIREEDRVYAIRILQWLTFAERPLTIEEVAEVAAIDTKGEPMFDRDEVLIDPLEALDICSSLITVTGSAEKRKNENGRLADPRILSLAHYSVQEYLVSDRIKQGPANQYHMQEGESHEAIMKGCIGYLNQFQGPISTAQFDISALAMYSAEFWISHFGKAGDEKENICRLALSVFSKDNPVYHSWLRLSDPELADYVEGPELERELNDMATPLYYAARLGLSKITQLLLDQGADIDVHGGLRENALLAALTEGHTTVAKLLINAGANVNINVEDWGTPLYIASQDGDEAMVKLLIDAGADINTPMSRGYPDGGNALQAAIGAAGEATVKLLLERGADCGLDEQLKGPIHHVAEGFRCMPSLVSILQQHGAPLDTIDANNMTPLHYCVIHNNQRIAIQLLDAGVPIDIGVRRKSWPRHCDTSSHVDQMDTVHQDAEPIAVGLTPLHFAALVGNVPMTKFLLDHGADPNALSEYGESPLHLNQRIRLYGMQYDDNWADKSLRAEQRPGFVQRSVDPDFSTAASAREKILDALLERPNISTAAQDCQGENLLHCIKYGKPESATLVQKFLSRGADPSCVNLSRKSPLRLAIEACDTASTVALLSTSSQAVWSEKCLLDTLNDAFWKANHEVIVAILETREARALKLVAAKDEYGQNLLHRLFFWGQYVRIETVQWLLDQGTNGSELDHSGVSPLARLIQKYAWYSNLEEICRLLLKITGNESFVDCNGQGLGHLYAASLSFEIFTLKALNDHGVDLAKRDRAGRTVLHRAAMSGSLTEESLEFLVNVIGIQANEQDAHGRTALQYAIEKASKEHDSDTMNSERWERTRDMLLKHHANHKS